MSKEKNMKDIVNFAKNYGFVFPGSEIYGGLANTWDYGPLGSELKKNIKEAWWNTFVNQEINNVGVDSSILLNPKVWEASGHIGGFSDPLTDCKSCKTRHRADKLIEEFDESIADGWTNEKMMSYILDNNIVCPNCKALDYTEIRSFNLMFKTKQGVTEDASSDIYLRPETAQGIFLNFKNISRSSRKAIPFGIGQIGKSFRNEITPGNFIFRTREFEQMELEFFCKPGTDLEWYQYYQKLAYNFLTNYGISENNIRLREHKEDELSHYSTATSDIEYQFPFGWGELWGIANRTDFDLNAHQIHSGVDLEYQDQETLEKFLPYVIEPSVGVDRLLLAILIDAYNEEEGNVTLKLHPKLAPVKIVILPLTKKQSDIALPLVKELSKYFNVDFDAAGKIGKRYHRADAIGVPYCITVDYDTSEDSSVTIRFRDSKEQVRVKIDELVNFIQKDLNK